VWTYRAWLERTAAWHYSQAEWYRQYCETGADREWGEELLAKHRAAWRELYRDLANGYERHDGAAEEQESNEY